MTKLSNLCMQCPIWIGIKLASGIKLATQCPDPYLGCRPENSQKTKDLYSSPSYIYIDVLLARPRTHSLVGTCVNVLIKRLPSKVSLHILAKQDASAWGQGGAAAAAAVAPAKPAIHAADAAPVAPAAAASEEAAKAAWARQLQPDRLQPRHVAAPRAVTRL